MLSKSRFWNCNIFKICELWTVILWYELNPRVRCAFGNVWFADSAFPFIKLWWISGIRWNDGDGWNLKPGTPVSKYVIYKKAKKSWCAMFDCLIIMKFQSGHRNMAPAWVSSDWKDIGHKKFREKNWFLAVYDRWLRLWLDYYGQGIDSKYHVWFKDFDCVHLP